MHANTPSVPTVTALGKNKLVILHVTVYCKILVFGNLCNGVLLLGFLFWVFWDYSRNLWACCYVN